MRKYKDKLDGMTQEELAEELRNSQKKTMIALKIQFICLIASIICTILVAMPSCQ